MPPMYQETAVASPHTTYDNICWLVAPWHGRYPPPFEGRLFFSDRCYVSKKPARGTGSMPNVKSTTLGLPMSTSGQQEGKSLKPLLSSLPIADSSDFAASLGGDLAAGEKIVDSDASCQSDGYVKATETRRDPPASTCAPVSENDHAAGGPLRSKRRDHSKPGEKTTKVSAAWKRARRTQRRIQSLNIASAYRSIKQRLPRESPLSRLQEEQQQQQQRSPSGHRSPRLNQEHNSPGQGPPSNLPPHLKPAESIPWELQSSEGGRARGADTTAIHSGHEHKIRPPSEDEARDGGEFTTVSESYERGRWLLGLLVVQSTSSSVLDHYQVSQQRQGSGWASLFAYQRCLLT